MPLDEVLAEASVDLSGRPYVVHSEPAGMAPYVGQFPTTLTRHIGGAAAMGPAAGIQKTMLGDQLKRTVQGALLPQIQRMIGGGGQPQPQGGQPQAPMPSTPLPGA